MARGHLGVRGQVVLLVALARWREPGVALNQLWVDTIAVAFQLRPLRVQFLRAQAN